VADAALAAGASIVNDISGLRYEPELAGVAARRGAPIVLMHTRGRSRDMYEQANYHDVVAEVLDELRESIAFAAGAGVPREQVLVDPGLGFAKTEEQNFVLMRHVAGLLDLGRPLLVGPSRKSFIGKVLGTDVDQRMEGTAGAVAWMVGQGAHIVRVHDVKAMVRVVRVVDAITRAPDAEGR
jgi:dihydropteroate synthase